MIYKQIDFTQPGGFPFTQDTLAFLQDTNQQVQKGMLDAALANGLSSPVIISGIRPTVAAPLIYLSGWIYYNGDLIQFTGPTDTSGLPALTGGLVYGFAITETDTPLTFNDGSTPSVLKMKTCSIAGGAAGLSSNFIPLTTIMLSMQEGLRETAWTHAAIAGGGIAGDFYYRKNFLNNTLEIRGTCAVTSASISIPPVYLSTSVTLPAGYRPAAQNVAIAMLVRYHGAAYILDAGGNDHMIQINGEIDTSGNLTIGAIKTASNYSVYFSTIISLD